ncbi:MAG: archaeosortase/exosortase family protein [Candidatus Woesearchaeota archaeon]
MFNKKFIKIKEMLNNKGLRQFLIRYILFLLLSFVIIPKVFYLISEKYQLSYYVMNYTYLPLFALMMSILFLFFYRTQLLHLKNYKLNKYQTIIFLIASILIFCVYFYLKYFPNSNFEKDISLGLYHILTIFTYSVATFILGLSIFNFNFIKRFYEGISMSILLSLSFLLLNYLLRLKWLYFSKMISTINFFIFNYITSASLNYAYDGSPMLKIMDFEVIIGNPCSGIDSLTLFILLFIGIISFDWTHIKMSKFKLSMFFLIGLLGMFLVSIIRIFLIMLIGGYWSREIALGLFHSNAGWILFIVYVGIYWKILYPLLLK